MPASNSFWSGSTPWFGDDASGRSRARRTKSLLKFNSALLDEQRRRFERWLGEPLLPPILGCGRSGCVVMGASGTKLLKLTVDPAEPQLARLIGQLQKEDAARGEMLRAGVVKIHRVARVGGRSWRYGRSHPLYAIAREAVIPIDDAASRLGSDPLATWLRRKRRRAASRSLLEQQLQTSMDRVDLNGESIVRPPGWVSERTKDLLGEIDSTLDQARLCRTARARARREAEAITHMAELSSYPEGEPIGEAMMALLAGFDVPLRDVHIGNIGLRTEPVFEGVQIPSLVLFDFGNEELERVPRRRLPELKL